MTTAVDLQGLGLKLGNQYLVKDIHWQVEQGQHWVIFGMNGSGKTTLLSIVSGFMPYTHGTLEVLGQSYNEDTIFDLRRRIGWVSGSFFDKCLSRELVLDIVLSGKFGTLGLDQDITDPDVRRAKALLKELRLQSKINYPFDFLSKGERQNVLIARALFSNPEILILDEPCTGLDVFAREYLLTTIADLAQNTNMTILFVTHHTEEILKDFSHCLLLQQGTIFAQGKTEQLFTSNVLSRFFQYPVQVHHHHGRINLSLSVPSHMRELMQHQDQPL